ncbi:HPP family protein [Streptomyces sp. NPDC089799]|uniref:HPP family protein n=1 Tax=Streptomyces sp. NPDC089799 TaxID=3155066 RepID=UPI00341E1557
MPSEDTLTGSPAAPAPTTTPALPADGGDRPRTGPARLARLLRPLAGRAPAPPAPAAALHNMSAATAVLLALVGIGTLIHEPVLIPPLAASAALVHSVPGLPLAQPRSLVAGHLLCAGLGYAALHLLGSSPWTAALAAGVSLAVMALARTPHSPAAATTVVVVLQSPAPARFLPLLAGSTLLLVLAGWAASRARRTAPRYPVYWW